MILQAGLPPERENPAVDALVDQAIEHNEYGVARKCPRFLDAEAELKRLRSTKR